MRINCVIIDDEFLARDYIKSYIEKLPFLNLVADFNSPLKAIDLIKSGKIDLLFLDIQMPDITGLDFIKTLDNPPNIIITTAYKEFALEGYELNVIDYILKPFSFERFIKATNKALEKMETESKGTQKIYTNETETSLHKDYLIIRADRKHYKVNYSDLTYIEGQKAYVTFYTPNKNITALASLKELEENLPKDQFIRIHKSYIVSIKLINALEGNMVQVNDVMLPIGKSYREGVDKLFGLG